MTLDIILTLLYGLFCGYIAGRIIGEDGFGLIGNLVVGIVGSFIGKWGASIIGFHLEYAWMQNFICSICGAIMFIVLIRIAYRLGEIPRKKRKH